MTSYGSVPPLSDAHAQRGYGFQDSTSNNANMSSPLSQSAGQEQGRYDEDYDLSRPTSVADAAGLNRSASRASTAVGDGVSRNNTLKKRASVRRTGSLKRSGSKRSLKAGSIKGFGGVDGANDDFNNVFATPVPTSGTPTEVLANRFQAWRQLLKSLITYFREIQNSYDARAKAMHKVQNTLANITHPAVFMSDNGLGDASRTLDEYHKRVIAEANKSKDIENDVIGALTGLRSDLGQKIKEIKSLSGDFKNSVEREKDTTRKEVEKLQEALQHADHEDGLATGKSDPFVVRLGVDRAIEKQIDEENYLHRAYLNLESSGRELESIVVGEIQKAYNAFAGILKREGDDAYNTVELLRSGPIAMPKDQEWITFVRDDPHFVDPRLPLRRIEEIEYPGKHHPAATEIRAGMLERKSKYLKSYTPGWYVLSPTHLHEFKSADKIYSQPPVMSLYLLDQKLGSHSETGSSSHKFMLKGKQSGGMHKGHNWVFRAETYDTMLAWFEDIRILTEKTGEERSAFVRKHARSVSGMVSDRATVSSDGLEEDEADQVPYSADAASLAEHNPVAPRPQRPQPGGRFPSDMALRTTGTFDNSTVDSDDDRDAIVATGATLGSAAHNYGSQDPYRLDGVTAGSRTVSGISTGYDGTVAPTPSEQQTTNIATAPVQTQTYSLPTQASQPVNQQQQQPPVAAQLPANNKSYINNESHVSDAQPLVASSSQQPFLGAEPAAPLASNPLARNQSNYGDWMAPAAAAAAGVGAGVVGADAYQRHQQQPQHDAAVLPETYQPRGTPVVAASSATTDFAAPAISGVPPTPSTASINTLTSPQSATFPTASDGVTAAAIGGNEKEGAHETGAFFPRVVRHDTNMSVSKLHVPGEYPKRA